MRLKKTLLLTILAITCNYDTLYGMLGANKVVPKAVAAEAKHQAAEAAEIPISVLPKVIQGIIHSYAFYPWNSVEAFLEHNGLLIIQPITTDAKIVMFIELADGRIATGLEDGTVQIWDISDTNHACAATLEGSASNVKLTHVLQLADGKIAAAYGNTIKIWDVTTGKNVANLSISRRSVSSPFIQLAHGKIAYVYDSSFEGETSLHIYDLAGGEPEIIPTTLPAKGLVNIMQLTNGSIAASRGERITIVDLATKKEITLDKKSTSITAMTPLTDGKIASCSRSKDITIWDLATQKSIATFSVDINFIQSMVQLTENRIAVANHDTIVIWDLVAAKCPTHFQFNGSTIGPITHVSGNRIAYCENGKKIGILAIKKELIEFVKQGLIEG
jgi:WD40 repeat protein